MDATELKTTSQILREREQDAKIAAMGGRVSVSAPIKGSGTPAEKATSSAILATLAPGASGNQLGGLAGQPITGSVLKPSLVLLVNRHFSDLVDDKELASLKAIAAEFAKEQAIMLEHTGTLWQAKQRELVQKYAASPTKENLRLLRESKTLSESDHVNVKQHAINRVVVIENERLSPLALPIYERAVNLIEADAQTVFEGDAAPFLEFGLAPVPSPLVQGLRKVASEIGGNLKWWKEHPDRFPYGGQAVLPDLLVAILARADAPATSEAESAR